MNYSAKITQSSLIYFYFIFFYQITPKADVIPKGQTTEDQKIPWNTYSTPTGRDYQRLAFVKQILTLAMSVSC